MFKQGSRLKNIVILTNIQFGFRFKLERNFINERRFTYRF